MADRKTWTIEEWEKEFQRIADEHGLDAESTSVWKLLELMEAEDKTPKMMTAAECRLFINQWDKLTYAGAQASIEALFAPVREAMEFGGFKNLSSYLEACVRVDDQLRAEG